MLSLLYQRFTPYEWLLTNRKGGYALGTAFLANVRKYHGLLIAGKERGKRYHLLAGVEEKVLFPSGLAYQLDANFYRDVIHPQGYQNLKDYFYHPYPVFYFYCPKTEAGEFLKKTLQMHQERNVLLISYENISSYPFRLLLRPRLTFRDHHQLTYAQNWSTRDLEVQADFALIAKDDLALFCYVMGGGLIEDPIFYYGVYYPLEEMRGYPAFEDHFSPFRVETELKPGEKLLLLFSDSALTDPQATIEQVMARYHSLPKFHPRQTTFDDQKVLALLSHMLRAFLLQGNVCAGYPWFFAWGRDTFIGLPALFEEEDGLEVCDQIFESYARLMKKGNIPNLIGDIDSANYNSVDTSLWFGLRIFEYLERFGNQLPPERRERLLHAVEDLFRGYISNTEHPFYVDPEDGFITIPESSGLALTWMDVMLDGRPLTPRYEKPIEVQFLWYNLLKFAKNVLDQRVLRDLSLSELTAKVEKNLGRFFNGELFADRIFRDEPIYEVRPNFVIALSLPYVPFDRSALERAVEVVRRELLTPYGLRSLSPRHPQFKRKYFGSQYQRDLAYHNGTVWVWLLYPYAKLLEKFLNKEDYLAEVRKLVSPFIQLLRSGKLSAIPEVYDGDQPFYPKGAPAQFWSTAAVYCLAKEIFK